MKQNHPPIETLGPDRTGLVLFDPLHGYLHPEDARKAAALKKARIVENIVRFLNTARAVNLTVFYAHGDHSPDGSDVVPRVTDTDMDLNPWEDRPRRSRPRFRRGDKEVEIAVEVAPQPGDVMVPKHRWNAFFQTHLELSLRSRGLDTVVLAGGSTDVGIASTAFAARDLDFGLVVLSDACFSHRGPNHDFFMQRVFPRMGRVMDVAAACELVQAGAAEVGGRPGSGAEGS